MIKEIKQDIFSCKVEAVVNTINCVGNSGAGYPG